VILFPLVFRICRSSVSQAKPSPRRAARPLPLPPS